MVCEICGVDAVSAILPIHQPNGSLITLGCLDCARTQGVWCDRHNSPHIDLGDGHGCLRCIEVETQSTAGTDYLVRLKAELPVESYEELIEWVQTSGAVSGSDRETALRRFVITRAHAHGITVEEVIERVVGEQSADFLFPNPYL
ncbi:hypothetical protein A2215_04555 [Candidatus Berkelbacteria bacterium RIFOXYA2_FULL_43_10]|uniref:Uncharacterized protein n=1 Tax=Candidatus Berkelbacteria bacterium RIFOXYA2_FULL_43_10 TaxID=1797472 RepID=A0A1F5E3Z8_9BACT|nr:MAG: hypothetical protein A2215_04555 [Candidatus Berkelbacteria bacterium RIFOXYA2_FULL_43_10]